MIYCSEYGGILFVEGPVAEATILRSISVKVNVLSQGRSIISVKESLAAEALRARANCVLNFEYGQKASWFLSGDKVAWYGRGDAATISSEIGQALRQNPGYQFPNRNSDN